MEHSKRDIVTTALASWFKHLSIAKKRKYGYYANSDIPETCNVLVESLEPGDIAAFVEDLSTYYDQLDEIPIFMDNRDLERKLRSALIEAGFQKRNDWIYILHNGEKIDPVPVAGITLEEGTEDNILENHVVKIKGFKNSEDDPTPTELESEIRFHRSEMAKDTRHIIARFEGEAVGIIRWNEGTDRLLTHLATRVPFRNRGIARYLLTYAISESYEIGCRSVSGYTDPVDDPIAWYRRLGFTDEIYWQGRYQYKRMA